MDTVLVIRGEGFVGIEAAKVYVHQVRELIVVHVVGQLYSISTLPTTPAPGLFTPLRQYGSLGSPEVAPCRAMRPPVRVWRLRRADAGFPLLPRAGAAVVAAAHGLSECGAAHTLYIDKQTI
eukprot:scaffold94452_cov75-Phaeocystis_antarctica.AAC.7